VTICDIISFVFEAVIWVKSMYISGVFEEGRWGAPLLASDIFQ